MFESRVVFLLVKRNGNFLMARRVNSEKANLHRRKNDSVLSCIVGMPHIVIFYHIFSLINYLSLNSTYFFCYFTFFPPSSSQFIFMPKTCVLQSSIAYNIAIDYDCNKNNESEVYHALINNF
jgi:hypothetical protein